LIQHDTISLEGFEESLNSSILGEVRFDLATRILYSTDASIYQISPIGAAFPRSENDVAACIEISRRYKAPVIPRGAGSSLAGQAIGPGLILDCSRYLRDIIEINPEEKTATLGPGVLLSRLNQAASRHRLQFGPDPASAERATIGGSLANNATGMHSVLYGMSADHLISADVVLSDGSSTRLEPVSIQEAARRARRPDLEGEIYRTALKIREYEKDEIIQRWPKTWRRASGYNLNYLLPWSPAAPPYWLSTDGYPPVSPGMINLAQLFAGSEGTLGVFTQVKVRLVDLQEEKILLVVAVGDLLSACEEIPGLLSHAPSAIELIPSNLLRLARRIPAYARQLAFIDELTKTSGEIPNLLVLEFAGDNHKELISRAMMVSRSFSLPSLVADDPFTQNMIWTVRKVGLGLLMSMPGNRRPVSFIEDLSVPIEMLSVFVREMQAILAQNGTSGDFYAHASAGCLHMRPILNPKAMDFSKQLRKIASEAVDLVIGLGGSVSGEHGDGIARSEWLVKMFGERLVSAFRQIKQSADPDGIMNPGKIVDPYPMDAGFRSQPHEDTVWPTVLSFENQSGLSGAVELCNGAAVCRKESGVMCPSFQATLEEMHSTRGRANLLRAMLAGAIDPHNREALSTVFAALDLCLACKGCKSECPSAVDMAKLKYEFLEYYYRELPGTRRALRDYLFAYIDRIAEAGVRVLPFSRLLIGAINKSDKMKSLVGFSPDRKIPMLSPKRFSWLSRNSCHTSRTGEQPGERVIFLSDPFTEYFNPEVSLQAVRVLEFTGRRAVLLPVIGAGRTLISKGFLREARSHAHRVLTEIRKRDPKGELPVVGVEPSEIYTLRDEYLDLFPEDEYVVGLADRTYMVDEYLIRQGERSVPAAIRIAIDQQDRENHPGAVLLHGHCYQKAQLPRRDGYPVGVEATRCMLEMAGYTVEVIDAGCCGMAGAFGYELEHYALSMRIGELSLFPAIRAAPYGAIIAAPGFSCSTQIVDGTGRQAFHPITLFFQAVKN